MNVLQCIANMYNKPYVFCFPLQILLVAMCPLLAFLLKFVRKDEGQPRLDEACLFDNEIEAAETSTTIQPVINVTLCGGKRDEISYPKAIWKSFNTPFIKCAHYAVSLWSCFA